MESSMAESETDDQSPPPQPPPAENRHASRRFWQRRERPSNNDLNIPLNPIGHPSNADASNTDDQHPPLNDPPQPPPPASFGFCLFRFFSSWYYGVVRYCQRMRRPCSSDNDQNSPLNPDGHPNNADPSNVNGPSDVTISIVQTERRKALQEWLSNELTKIINENDNDESLKMLDSLISPSNPKLNELIRLIEEITEWDASDLKPTTAKSVLLHAKCQSKLGYMFENNERYQPHLERIIERFGMENEIVVPESRKISKENAAGSSNSTASKTNNAEKAQKMTMKKAQRRKGKTNKITGQPNAALHFAVISLNIEFVKWLLGRENINVNIRNRQGKTPLFLLCEQYGSCIERELLEDIKECIRLLLKKGGNFNICSVEPLLLPFDLLLRNTTEETEKFVEECVARFNGGIVISGLPVNEKIRFGESISYSKTISKDWVVRFYQQSNRVIVTVELLEIYLRFKECQKFIREFERIKIEESSIEKVIKLLLYVAIELNLEACVKSIVECAGSTIFRTVEGNDSGKMEHRDHLKGLLRKTCESGSVEILNLLLSNINDQELLNLTKPKPILNDTLNMALHTRRGEISDNIQQCAAVLAQDKRISTTITDPNGYAALEFALKYSFTDVALSLLQDELIYLGIGKNRASLLNYSTYDLWKLYFDQCVLIQRTPIDRDMQEIKFNLSGMNPFTYKKNLPQASISKRAQKVDNWTVVLKPSLWDDIDQNKTPLVNEMDVAMQIAENGDLLKLLLHPVVFTFIMTKWIRVAQWCNLNFLLTVSAAICFGLYALEQCSDNSLSSWPEICTWIGATYLFCRELMQICIIQGNYFRSWENLLDIATIVAMVGILVLGCNSIVASLTVIAFALQITILIGLLPFSSLSVYTHMFITVSINFAKSFLLFVPLLTAFTYSFFLSYKEISQRNVTSEDDENKFAFFSEAALTTIVMSTGEFEASSLEFTRGKLLLFILFMFFGYFVIQNLINGLAITDIAAIAQHSELISIRKKVFLLHRYEMGVQNCYVQWFLRKFPSITQDFSFFKNYSHFIIVKPKELNKVLIQAVHPLNQKPTLNKPRNYRRKLLKKNVDLNQMPSNVSSEHGDEPKASLCQRLTKYLSKKSNTQNVPSNKQQPPAQRKVVSKLPAGLFADSEGLYVKCLQLPLFLTVDKPIMDETWRIVDDQIKKRQQKPSERLM